MSCPNCNMTNHSEAAFCQKCGIQLAGDQAEKKAKEPLPRLLLQNWKPDGNAPVVYDRKVIVLSSVVIAWYFLVVSAMSVMSA